MVTIKVQTKRKIWEFPKDRFVEWGPEDESYCRLAGYGKEIEAICYTEIPKLQIQSVKYYESNGLIITEITLSGVNSGLSHPF